MDAMTIAYIMIAFAVGLVVGWITIIIPSGGRNNLTREDVKNLNRLIERATNMNRGFTITLFSEGNLVDQVTVQNERR